MSKIIFELVLQDVNAAAAIAKFRQEVKDANAEIKRGVGGDRFKELTEKVTDAKVSIFKLTEEQKRLRKEFAATQVPTDSLAGLRIAYAQVTEQVTKLTRAERESNFGKKLIKDGAGLKAQIDGIEQSLGRFTGNVGNYKSALLGIGDIITGGLATGGIVIGVQKVIEAMGLGINQAIKYEKALDDLSALTGLTGSQLQGLQDIEQSLRQIELNGVEIVNTGPEILNALKLVGGARPELLKDAEALGEVTKQAIVLSQASGDELEPSVKALTTILGQFNLNASQSERVINELAAGAKEGAAEIPQITDSLREFGTVAKISNVTTSESIALIEVLADRQLKGAEAGTQLRNILSKLASANILPKSAQAQFEKLGIDINVLKDATIPFETRLRELGKAQGDLSALTKIFGLENLQAATIITSGLDKYTALNTAVQGTSEAYKQAEIRSGNFATQLENLKNKGLNSLQEEFDGATSSGSALVSIFDFLIDKVNILGFIADLAVGPIKKLIEGFKETVALFSGGEEAQQGAFFDISAVKDETDALVEEAKRLSELSVVTDKTTKSTKDFKEEVVLVNGSLAFFRDQIADLKKTLDNTPTSSPLFHKLEKDIDKAEKNLSSLEKKLAELRNPTIEAPPIESGLPLEFTSAEDAARLKSDQAERERIVNLNTFRQDQEEENADFEISVAKDLAAGKIALTDDEKKAKDKAAEDDKKRREDTEEAIKDAALNTASAIADGIFSIQKDKQDREKQAALDALDAETKKKIEAANGDAVLIAKIEKDADKKKAAIEKEAGRRAKKLALQQAEVDIALSILKALAAAPPPFNFILAAASAVAGAIQLVAIKKQEFARGGTVKTGTFGGRPHSAGGTRGRFDDGTEIEVEKDEDFIILNKRASAERRRLSDLNHRHGGVRFDYGGAMSHITGKLVPQFALGGFASDFTPQIALPQVSGGQTIVVQTVAEISDDQMNLLAARIAAQTGRATKEGVGEGLEDNNRLQERQAALTRNREA